ncbi:Epidermal growth factor-like domain and Laminin G domain and Concanavalin A-like lectin/glucanases superfamily domain and Insulin-like growth factor binding protein, N-terminal domain and Concanavalin A-like lectin/glucanase, subgroup domain and Immunoglobulin-like fold domain-containing protein [Strongyloides ratti]|uniref:Basement membrane-specific heparan sulfate proteoglycan core protein n=1 Tax=Strongyloides ratti TaxID=34506 RepID=A0A090KRJ9_STRRB|nr:Epidermal growth factor-like domain and Laminin G domain and Concanavalin A-like lectin/glucanases superfamily domain and Insulin-like growth factor binding protein, N-terminal domain and Concanavalin A-like lectin/glucanase, subgroup domain and Immunoglobulin-like fold domain-containing protein [Strongyloides ratti]CEF60015.1 Epidermal growth factor-like domain and Laminin G domain and Concanavalin A-like lectin/glucanases superfamily domain and Insulin-like growth factor binding protein, N-te
MPFSYKIDNNGILSINNVKIKDSGLYECIEQQINGKTIPSKYVLLTVTQLVPRFDGKSYLSLQPISPEQWRDLNMNITIKPSIKDGIILYVEKNSGQYNNPENYHEIKLKNGKVVYDYDIGNGNVNITSKKEIQLNEWSTISIMNDENMAKLIVNNENAIIAENDGQKIYENIPSSNLNIGGKEISTKKLTNGKSNDVENYFVGSISQLIVSNRSFDIGSNVVRIHGTVQQSKICSPNPCRNNGQCHTANVLMGFICHCREGYIGNYCEIKNNICNGNLNCEKGICSMVDNEEKCICPYGRSGKYCQIEDKKFLDTFVESIQFNGKTSFVKIPIKNKNDDYNIQMNIKFSNLDDNQIIAHISDSGKEKNKEYINIAVEDNKFSVIQSTKTSKKKKVDKTRLINDDIHKIELIKKNDKMIVMIDGDIILTGKTNDIKNEISLLEEKNGYIIVGQIPPGLSRFDLKTFSEIDSSSLETYSNVPYGFNGCLVNITYNGKNIPTTDILEYNSGDINKCETKNDNNLFNVSFHNDVNNILNEKNNSIQTILTSSKTLTIEQTQNISKDGTLFNDNFKPTLQNDTYSDINNYRLPQSGETDDSVENEIPKKEGNKGYEKDNDKSILNTINNNIITTKNTPLIHKIEWITTSIPITEITLIDNITKDVSIEEKKSSEIGMILPTDSSSTENTSNYIEPPYNKNIEEYDEEYIKTTPHFDIPSNVDSEDDITEESYKHIQVIDRCEHDTCGSNGICEEVNSTHIACSCKISFDGPRCDIFKPIEYAAKFNGEAFIMFSPEEFPHLTSEQIEVIELRVKTSHKYGVLLWQSATYVSGEYPTDYVSLGISDGYLVFSYELGGGAARIISRDIISDGKEHYIKVVRKGRNGSLYVDNSPVVKGESSGILAMLNVDSYIYLGGLPRPIEMTGEIFYENFKGCIAELSFNGDKIGLMENAVDGQNVLPCSEWPSPYVRKRWFRNRKYKNL